MIAAVAAIGAAGFFITRSLPSPGTAAAGDRAADPAPPTRTAFAGRGGGGSSAATRAENRRQAAPEVCAEEAIARMEAIIRGNDEPDRGRTLLTLVDQLGPDELEGAIAHFRSLGRSDSRFGEVGMLLAARFLPLAPSGTPHLPGRLPGDRVAATAPVAETPQRKFPEAFYRGKNSFPPSAGAELNAAFAVPYQIEPPMFMEFAVTNFALSSTAATDSVVAETATETPVEADIWRTDGNTVYFFNQLRGLQVLDLSAPADPRLVATLRLPAVGEDLYLLPGAGASRTLVLLTRVTGGEPPATRINMVTVTGGAVAITHHLEVPGVLADSRMVGDKLALVTTARSNDQTRWDLQAGNSITAVSQWLIAAGKAPEAAGQAEMQTANPVIAAGADWLALAGCPAWNATHSEVRVFGLGGAGLSTLTPVPVRTAGIVLDKFKLRWRDNVLTTISEKRRDGTAWTVPITVLENFLVPGRNDATAAAAAAAAPLLGSLELASGERLYATRFAENKAYVVTFRQTDPLWIVDLADPAAPLVSGHLEVPGWSTYLEPIGDLLFSVGWESGTLAASLFDVADPASPKLLRRLNLGSSATRSEAAWNEKALKIIPEAGLAMIPFQTFDRPTNAFVSVVQLLDLDIPARDLRRRGAIRHEFDARRSEMIGQAVVSISQKALVAADIADRDAPAVLSEVALAWPVDRVLEAGAHLLQIESGGSSAGRATVRISPAHDSEAVLSEFDLGDGRLCAAAVRDGRLFILRDDSPGQFVSAYSGPVAGDGDGGRRLHLELYDLASLPLLTLAGTCSVELASGVSIASDLLWPRPHLPAVVVQSRSAGGRFYPGLTVPISMPTLTIGQPETIAMDGSAMIGGLGIIGGHSLNWAPIETRHLLVFNTTDAAAPTAGEPFAIGTEETVSNGVYQAADGLFVTGAAEWQPDADDSAFAAGTPVQVVRVVEIGNAGDPVARPPIDLPGALFAIGDLDRDGFLAYTRGADAEGNPTLQVSACDGFDAFEITSLKVSQSSALAAGGWRLFLAADHGVERFRLSEEGEFVAENGIQLGWQPAALSWLDGVLIGRDQRSLFAAGATAAEAIQWPFPAPGLGFANVSLADDGDLLAPLGDYGVERFQR
jgi:hypothetical protein